MSIRFANLYLAGAPKCGTTSLASWLTQHRQIFAPMEKEPIVFGSDLTLDGRRTPETLAERHFAHWDKELYALDASTHYFYSRTAPAEIKRARPDARVYVLLRNPADAVNSMFHQLRFNGTEELQTVEQSLAAEAGRSADLKPLKRGIPESLLYTRVFRYAANIQNFREHFDETSFRVLLFEDLKSDPAAMLRSILEDLELETGVEDRIDFSPQNGAKKPRSRTVQSLVSYPPAWLGYISKPLMSQERRMRLRQWLRGKNIVADTNPQLARETRQLINYQFAADIAWLEDYLQRDLSHWKMV